MVSPVPDLEALSSESVQAQRTMQLSHIWANSWRNRTLMAEQNAGDFGRTARAPGCCGATAHIGTPEGAPADHPPI